MDDTSGISVLTPSSPSTQNTTTQLSTNRNLGQLLDTLSSGSGDSTALLNQIADAITTSIIGGTTGSNANRILTAKGTSGIALQPSVVSIDGSGNITGANSLSLPLTTNKLVVSNASNPGALTTLSPGTTGQFLRSTGSTTLPSFQTFTVTIPDGIGGLIPFPTNQNYLIWLGSPFAASLTSFSTICASGSCTAALFDGSTFVTNSVTTVQQTNTFTRSLAAGGSIFLIVSANASCTDFSFMLAYNRTIF